MLDLTHASAPRSTRPIAFVITIALLLTSSVALLAVASGFGLLPLPYPLFLVLRRLPVAFPLHMIASGLALILIPIAALVRHRRGVHRLAGRAAAVCVMVGGATALAVALASEATPAARAGLFTQGAVWLGLLAAAIAAIRRGAVAPHMRLMIAMAAVASGAIWLRLAVYAGVAAGLPFDPLYATATWMCWFVPLVLTIAVMKVRALRSA